MKSKIIATIAIFFMLFVGCKNEKSLDSLEVVQPEEINENNFKVTLDLIIKKDDNLSLYYTEDGSIDFTKIPPIWIGVKGSDSSQKVVFDLPEDVVPTQIRLDFGISKEQETIIVNGFSMHYLGKTFKEPGENFYIYFTPDVSKTIFDKDKKSIDAVVKDGVRQFPSFYPNTAPLGDEISKLVK